MHPLSCQAGDAPTTSPKLAYTQRLERSIMTVNRITINGVTVEVEGENVSVLNGVIYVDGVAVQSQLSGDVHVLWHGDLASLEADGSVSCRNVDGDVTAGGSVQCRHVEGSVTAGGSVHTRAASAQASAVGFNGDIKVTAGGSSGSSVRVGHGSISVGHVHAGGSVHARGRRAGNIHAGGSVHLDD